MAVKRPWEMTPEWRQAAYALTSVATVCALCGLEARAYHAMPRNTDAPFDDLVAVCGYCRPHAMTRRVLPEQVVDGPAIWTRSEAQVNDPMRQRAPRNPLRPVSPERESFLALRARVLARDGGTCQYCGQHGDRIDKINAFQPWTEEANWVCACRGCFSAAIGQSAHDLATKRGMVLDARGLHQDRDRVRR